MLSHTIKKKATMNSLRHLQHALRHITLVASLAILTACGGDPSGGSSGSGIGGGPGGGGSGSGGGSTAPLITTLSAKPLALGTAHGCALRDNAAVACWGSNSDGQLGDGTLLEHLSPTDITTLPGVASVVAGGLHTCALKTNGTVACWGSNLAGQLGVGGTTSKSSPTDTGLANVVDIAAGYFHTCALINDGTVTCWGSNAQGQLGSGAASGAPQTTPLVVPSASLGNVVAIAAGGANTCAVKADKTVLCWGENDVGQTGNGQSGSVLVATPTLVSGLGNVASLAVSLKHACVLKADATLACWGSNSAGQLGNGTNGVGTFSTAPVAIGGYGSVVAVASHSSHTCAVQTGGALACWGNNGYGKLGDGTLTPLNKNTPTPVSTSPVMAIETGGNHTCALRTDHTVACWGKNDEGQLGDGTKSLINTNHSSPIATTAGAVFMH